MLTGAKAQVITQLYHISVNTIPLLIFDILTLVIALSNLNSI